MDYCELLRRYMSHVGEQEGTTFTGRSLDGSPLFTEEEKVFLKELSKDV